MFLGLRLVGALVIGSALALLVPGQPLVAVALADAVVLALAALDVARAVDPREVVRGRDHDPVASVGAETEVGLVAANPGPRRLWAWFRDAAAPSLRPEPIRFGGSLPPGITRLTYRLRPQRRGLFTLGPVTVRTHGPLGLGGRQRQVDLRTELKVYPALEGRKEVEGRIRRSRLLEVGSRSARIRGGGMEFDSLREYHPDDEFRRINWAATARASKPITNLYREERNQQVLLLLDAGRTMAGTVGGAPRFEHALDAAVAVATLALTVGDRVAAFAFDQRVRATVPPRADRAQARRIVDALFDIEPQLVAADYRGAVAAALGRFRRRALLLLFTDLTDEAAMDTLLSAIPALARRHLVVVAEVRDPEAERLARHIPRTAADAFAKAAAAASETRRDRAGARLIRLGAAVVDRPPELLAGAVADSYLTAKAYGRL